MGIDVTLWDKINKKEIPYIGGRAESFQILTSLILYWKEQAKSYNSICDAPYDTDCTNHPFAHFKKYEPPKNLKHLWDDFIKCDAIGNQIDTETDEVKIEIC